MSRARALVAGLLLAAVLPMSGPAAARSTVAVTGPPAFGQIVWTNRAADRERLYIAAPDGTGQRVLTRPAAGERDLDAQFSPDGQWIAYERDTDETAEVRLVRPDGTDDHELAVPCEDPCLGTLSPTWVAHERLVVTRVFGPIVDDNATEALLWTVRVDGTSLQRLSDAGLAGRYEDYYAHPSRDRSYLVFTRFRLSDGASALFRSDAAGGHLQRLLPWGLGVEISDLSTASSGPTQDLVLFEAYGRGDPGATFVDLGTVPATCASPDDCASAIVWLTDNAASGRRNANPHWAPGGRSLVFTDRASIDVPNAQVMAKRFGSTRQWTVSTSPRFDYRPDWGR